MDQAYNKLQVCKSLCHSALQPCLKV